MSKVFNEKNLLLILSFFIIVFVFINYIHNSSENYKLVENNTFLKLNNLEIKNNLNETLVSNESYNVIINENCEITGNMHNRHKVRWVKSYLLKNIFQFSNNLNTKLPYYINILLHSFFNFCNSNFFRQNFLFKKKIYTFFFTLYYFYFSRLSGRIFILNI